MEVGTGGGGGGDRRGWRWGGVIFENAASNSERW